MIRTYLIFAMKTIIQLTKGRINKATQKEVIEVIESIDKKDYELV